MPQQMQTQEPAASKREGQTTAASPERVACEVELRRSWPPEERLRKPHAFFPFDLFSPHAADPYLSEFLRNELGFVKDHCMVPPFPWGHVVYYDFIVKNLISVSGDFAEFGIGQGGTSVFLARLAKKYGRKFLAIDSFVGLPQPDMGKDNYYFVEGDYKAPPGVDNYEAFMEYMSMFDVEDVMYVRKGFFRDVDIPDDFEKFAFVHLDSDLYDSVYDSLRKVWDRLVIGGCIAVDDFFHHAQGPARAVSDFFRIHAADLEPPLLFVIPTYAVLIIKGRSANMQDQLPKGRVAEIIKSNNGLPVMYSQRALDGNFYSFKLVRSCGPFLSALEESVRRIKDECMTQSSSRTELVGALRRCLANAESFLDFLRYSDLAPRSGMDILRYLLPLEDLFDITQGSLCGMPGEARRKIEITIPTS
jgi:O-methyltransferase